MEKDTEYWLELLMRTGYLTEEQYNSIRKDNSEVAKLLTSIVKTAKG